jgi:hypothetical protein
VLIAKALPEAEERHQLRLSDAIDPMLAMLPPLSMLNCRQSGNRAIYFWGNESYGGEELHLYSITGQLLFALLILYLFLTFP